MLHVVSIEYQNLMIEFLHIKRSEGYCIHCESEIAYNPAKPLCANCLDASSENEDFQMEEDYCHCCGNMSYTSKEEPECYPCYAMNHLSGDMAKTG
jgi:hypothetical protein